MSGSTSNIAITITGTDNASPKIVQVNKTITALEKPVQKAGKALAGFSDASGLIRSAESMKSFGDQTLNAARALERTILPMGMLTGAGSIAGLAALTRQWGNVGNEIKNTSYLLNISPTQLSKVQNALELTGGKGEDAAGTLEAVNEAIQKLAFGQAGDKTGVWMNIFKNAGNREHQESAIAGLREMAMWLEKIPAAQRAYALSQAGLPAGAMQLVGHGLAAFDEAMSKTDKTGANWTNKMAENASQVSIAWNRLELDLKGVYQHIQDDWSGTVLKLLGSSTRLIEGNQDVAKSYGETGIAIGGVIAALLAKKPAMWVLRALGWEPLLVGAIAEGANRLPPADFQTGENTRTLLTPGGIGPRTGAIIDPSGGARSQSSDRAPAGPRAAAPLPAVRAARAKQAYDYYMSTGHYSAAQATGLVAEINLESQFNPRAVSSAGMPGLMQWDRHRRGIFKSLFGHDINDPSISDDQLVREHLQFSDYEMTDPHGEEHAAYQELRKQNTAADAAQSINKHYLRSNDYSRNDRGVADMLGRTLDQTTPATAPMPTGGTGPRADSGLGLVIPGPQFAGGIELNVTVIGAPHGARVTAAGGGTVKTVRSMPA